MLLRDARLEQLTTGTRVRGVTPDGVVEIVAAQFGTDTTARTDGRCRGAAR